MREYSNLLPGVGRKCLDELYEGWSMNKEDVNKLASRSNLKENEVSTKK